MISRLVAMSCCSVMLRVESSPRLDSELLQNLRQNQLG